jgi:hypothetical protein
MPPMRVPSSPGRQARPRHAGGRCEACQRGAARALMSGGVAFFRRGSGEVSAEGATARQGSTEARPSIQNAFKLAPPAAAPLPTVVKEAQAEALPARDGKQVAVRWQLQRRAAQEAEPQRGEEQPRGLPGRGGVEALQRHVPADVGVAPRGALRGGGAGVERGRAVEARWDLGEPAGGRGSGCRRPPRQGPAPGRSCGVAWIRAMLQTSAPSAPQRQPGHPFR